MLYSKEVVGSLSVDFLHALLNTQASYLQHLNNAIGYVIENSEAFESVEDVVMVLGASLASIAQDGTNGQVT